MPLLQPATKALAQMLAGRTGASGQLGHARSMLAQAERLIAERAHNRLNPAEREEFFEQLARLKLTLADAEVEAEIRAAEDETPAPPAPPVAQERLKEMALALTARTPPAGAERPEGPGDGGAAPADETAAAPAAGTSDVPEPDLARSSEAVSSAANRRAGRLELPRSVAGQGAPALQPGTDVARRRRLRAMRPMPPADASRPDPVESRDEPPAKNLAAAEEPGEAAAGNGAADEAKPAATPRTGARRATRKAKNQGVPEGWVIDDEGFVVPGHS